MSAFADSVKTHDQYKFQRKYRLPYMYAPITGYFTYLFGSSELEQTYGAQLSGSDSSRARLQTCR